MTTFPAPLLPYAAQLQALAEKHGLRRLEVFGSAARDDFDPAKSDFDFVVEFGDVEWKPWFGNYFDLKEDLEALLGRPVDLVEDRAIKKRYLRREVDRDRKVIYAR